METLHTMQTSAAPMAPMIAAALPPPGVASAFARRSKNSSIELCVIMSTDHRFGERVYFFRIEQQIVLFEQTRDACPVQSQLQRAEAERAEQYLAVALRAAIAQRHTFDARGRRGIRVGNE